MLEELEVSTMTSQVMELNRRILISDFDFISSENITLYVSLHIHIK